MSDTPALTTTLNEVEASVGFSRATVSMVITNPRLEDNPIVYVNDAFERMTGYSRLGAIGRNCRFLQGDETEPSDIAKLRDAVANGEEVAVDLLNYRANGEPFTNRLVISPILDEDGRVAYFFGVQKEMQSDERSGAEARADQQMLAIQDRVKDHLSMVIGMIRTQSREGQPSDEVTAPREFKALSRRVEALQFLYEEMTRSNETEDTVAIGTYIARLATAVAHVESRPGIRCVIDVEKMDAPVEVATRLGIVFSEILTNAFQHAFQGLERGLVEVRLSALSEGGLRLSVSDDGLGIPKAMDWPSRRMQGGRIIDGLIEGLGGTLNLGRGAAGTVITIDVPVGATAED